MEGNFKDGKNGTANIAGGVVFIAGFIATVIISVNLGNSAFTLFGMPITVFLMIAVDDVLSKGKFSADEKSVAFSVGFSKCEYSYKNIINIRTEIVFTKVRGSAKIPHIELVISLRNGKIARFSDGVPFWESESLESLKEFQKNHQFTKLADYIKSRLNTEKKEIY